MWENEADAKQAHRAVNAMHLIPDWEESAVSAANINTAQNTTYQTNAHPSWAPEEPESVQAGVGNVVPMKPPERPDVVDDEVQGVAAGTPPVPGSREEQLGQEAEPGSFEALQRMFGPPIPPPE
jgi:hypothetical protein